ncbi:MAG: hypothetical protein RJA98_2631, partial [Pseudomonadota bacterium]
FQALIDNHNETADRIAEQTGKSRSYVYGRLKLLAACPEVRKACLAGEIGAEVALLISRLHTIKMQGQALARIKANHLSLEDGGTRSYRDIRDRLREEFTLSLKDDCLFSRDDSELVPSAGACTTCPKRSGNSPVFEDLATDQPSRWSNHTVKGDTQLCTDPDCYQAKKTAHLKAQAEVLRKQGAVVIEGNAARNALGADGRVKGAYLALKDVKDEVDQTRRLGRPASCIPAQIVLIQDPRTGKTVQAVKESDLVAAGTRKATAKAARPIDDWKARQAADEIERKANAEKAQQLTAINMELLARVREAVRRHERDEADLRAVAAVTLHGIGHGGDRTLLTDLWGHGRFESLVSAIETMDVAGLNYLLMDCVLIKNVRVNPYYLKDRPTEMLAAAKRYGVSLAPTPTTAARAQEDAAAVARGVKYRNPTTGETWTGRGLKPRWMVSALAAGATLASFEIPTPSTAARAQEGGGGEAEAAGSADAPGGDHPAGSAALAQAEADDKGLNPAGFAGGLNTESPGSAGADQSVDAGDAGSTPAADDAFVMHELAAKSEEAAA